MYFKPAAFVCQGQGGGNGDRMPQTLPPRWIADLGPDYEEIHETWLHRLGNLTMTAYNSKYSNDPFVQKRDMPLGFKESGLRLNTWIAQQEKWTLDEIQARTNHLTQRALQIWEMPNTDFKPAEKQLDTYTLEDDVDLSGREIIRFRYKNAEQTVDSWVVMMEQVLKILHTEDQSVLTKLAHMNSSEHDLAVYVSNTPDSLRAAMQIDRDLFVERNTSTYTKITLLRKFFKAFGENPESLVFYLKDPAEDKTAGEEGTRYELRRRYWALAMEHIKAAHGESGPFKNVNPTKSCYLHGWFGISGFSISCEAKQNLAAVELELGKPARDHNKAAYDFLFARKAEIESKLGVPLNWWRFEGKSSYVDYHIDGVESLPQHGRVK